MSATNPELVDYLRLFERYSGDLGSIYLNEGDEDPYLFLFEQIVKLLIRPSGFNLSLPALFRTTALRYHRGDKVTLDHMSNMSNRHFMVCDLHDFILLRGGLKLRRR